LRIAVSGQHNRGDKGELDFSTELCRTREKEVL
jgi:hypothetical protein